MRELNRKPVRLDVVISEMVDFVAPTAKAAGIEIKTYMSSDLPAVPIDCDLFQQALLNLMLNAEQAMPDGGEMTIQTRTEGDMVRIDLIDTGTGMAPDILARAFKPFFTTKSSGNGLGLPTTRRIVEMHGGRIEAQSEPGKGTQFTIWLPTTVT
jgi:signal transduction histidine kinase